MSPSSWPVVQAIVFVLLACFQWSSPFAATADPAKIRHQVDAVRSQLNNRDWAALESQFSAVQASYEGDSSQEDALVRMTSAFYLPLPESEELFEAWTAAYPRSYSAHLAAGIFDFSMAMTWRTEAFA